VFDGLVAVVGREGVEEEAAEVVAGAQVLLIGGAVARGGGGRRLALDRGVFELEALDDALGDGVLKRDDVFGRGVHAVAPEEFAGGHV
jgi:hypothetical protein